MSLFLDYSYTDQAFLKEAGLSSAELQELMAEKGDRAYATLQAEKEAGGLGFAMLPYQTEEIEQIKALAEAVRQEYRNLLVIGIGGSDLGARAVQRALNHQFYNFLPSTKTRLFFVGDTTDPKALQEVLDLVDLQETAVAVISKSGNTIEQMSAFLYLRQALLEKVGESVIKERIIVLTDAKKGSLREIVEKEGYRSLPIPEAVGGRYSVLSSVGLFPLAVAGIEIEELLAGAREVDLVDSHQSGLKNAGLQYAARQYLYYQKGKRISVLLPYSYALKEVGFWFRQLWAESLGKQKSLSSQIVEVGPTPIAALGPTDQHSQLQLYMEGPADKLFTFIRVEQPNGDLAVPAAFPETEGASYLGGHHFQEILLAEQQSTAFALRQAGRPSCTLILDSLSPANLGGLLYFFELATAYTGRLFEINAFDQPGVELSKQYLYGELGRSGFSQYRIPINEKKLIINLNKEAND